jgi:hypothetical protein
MALSSMVTHLHTCQTTSINMVYTRLQKRMDAAAAIPATAATAAAATTMPAATTATTMPAAVPLSIAQIKTRSKAQSIAQEAIRHDTMIAAMGLLALHDMHDPANAGWFPDPANAGWFHDYVFQNRNDYTCNIL